MKSVLATAVLVLVLVVLLVLTTLSGAAMAASGPASEHGAICVTSPQLNSFESVCSGSAPHRAQGYFDLSEEASEPPSSPRDYSAWPAMALLIAFALGLGAVLSGISYDDVRARI